MQTIKVEATHCLAVRDPVELTKAHTHTCILSLHLMLFCVVGTSTAAFGVNGPTFLKLAYFSIALKCV